MPRQKSPTHTRGFALHLSRARVETAVARVARPNRRRRPPCAQITAAGRRAPRSPPVPSCWACPPPPEGTNCRWCRACLPPSTLPGSYGPALLAAAHGHGTSHPQLQGRRQGAGGHGLTANLIPAQGCWQSTEQYNTSA